MNRLWFSLALLIGLSTFVSGCSRYLPDNLIEGSLEESNSGIVWITYDDIVPKDNPIPVDAVNEFLLQEGYISEVVDTWYWQNGYSLQKIYLGVDVDPSPLLDRLRDIRGVLSAKLDVDTEGLYLSGLPPEGRLAEVLLDVDDAFPTE